MLQKPIELTRIEPTQESLYNNVYLLFNLNFSEDRERSERSGEKSKVEIFIGRNRSAAKKISKLVYTSIPVLFRVVLKIFI